MRIAEIANVIESIPPQKYGGTEFVISKITEGLVERGHEVTLFATQESATQAKLSSSGPSLGFTQPTVLAEVRRLQQFIHIAQTATEFDILHNHLLQTIGLVPATKTPIVTTLHTDLSRIDEQTIFQLPESQQTYFISISDSQRRALPHLPYLKTIYHGINVAEFPFKETPGEYLLFLGRITPEKGPEVAVEVAKATNRKLIVAAKVDNPESDYAKKILKLFAETPQVEYIGEVGEEKKDLYANAYALLMPIQWEEPFGLVVIEALACGTPVVAFNRGSMPEIITDKETGFLVQNTQEMIKAIPEVAKLSRAACRESVQQRFTLEKMVTAYEQAFNEVV